MALPNSSTYASVGGEITNYSPVEDPTTDLDANFSNEVRADVAAMTRMIPRARVSFVTDTVFCTITEHDAVWGNDVSIQPTVTADPVYAASYVVSWPTTVTDARGTPRALNLRRGMGSVESPGYVASVRRLDANSFRVTTASVTDSALAYPASPDDAITLWVW